MSAAKACIRLWIVGSATWVIFWIWNDANRCVWVHDVLWCPVLGDDAASPTTFLRMAANIFEPPLASWLLGGLCLLAIRASRHHLAQDAARHDGRPDDSP